MSVQNQIDELKVAMEKTKDRRHFERYQAVYLYLSGYKMKVIAEIINRHRVTVSNYISAYNDGNIAGLTLGHSPGKSPKLSEKQMVDLLKTISTKVPADVGFTARYNWTLALAVEFVENEFNVSYSLRGMSSLLHRLGLSYTRPTYTLEKADSEKQKEFVQDTFPAIKKTVK